MIKKGILLLMFVTLLMLPMTVQAKTAVRYATKTIALREKPKSKVIYRVKRNTKITVLKHNTTWSRVKYKDKVLYAPKKQLHSKKSVKKYTAHQLRRGGRLHWRGYTYTWYSQRVMPGRGLKIPGRHVDKNGYVCDKDDYIVVGSSVANKLKRVIAPTPFGKFGKCYDCGLIGSKHCDIYVAW